MFGHAKHNYERKTMTRAEMLAKQNQFWKGYYSGLEGVTIVKFLGMLEDEFGGKPFPQFLVKFPNGSLSTVEISCDEEGNGGGFIFGLPLPKDK
jgi:hypothetical protein